MVGLSRTGVAGAVVAGIMLALAGGPPPAWSLPASVDADGDGFLDVVETNLGSNPADPASVPESVAVPASCLDGTDNDGDGQTDLADPGCNAPAPSRDTFPGAGTDVFDSRLTLDAYPLATAAFGTCPVDFEGRGPTVVQRSAPVDMTTGIRQIDIEILALQLSGTATVLAGPGCLIPPGDYPVTMFEDPAVQSLGKVTDTDPDPSRDLPADSFFDVFFKIDTPVGVLDGGPPNGPPGAPVHVENRVATLPPYHDGENPLCYQVAGLPHRHCPKAPPDHFKCYQGKFPRFQPRPVNLRDQFGQKDTKASQPLLFCNPAAKNAEPLFDKSGHLECYKIKPEKIRRTVLVRNQFGVETVQVKKAVMLCVPSQKNAEAAPQETDHYKCYAGRFPRFQPRPVTLVDQFNTEQTKVLKPVLLCNPVAKNGEPIRDPLNHLKCYRIKPSPQRQTITVTNQFGTESVKIKKSALLCVPSSKSEQLPTTTTTTVVGNTTTTVPFITTLMTGYNHIMPGLSVACGKVSTTPPQPGATGTAKLTRPDSSMTMQDILLDGAGVARFQFPINDFGQYGEMVMVASPAGTGMASGTVNVTMTQSNCP